MRRLTSSAHSGSLPNKLTLGPAVLCLATSPPRSLGFVSSVTGAMLGLAIVYLPLALYVRLRGRTGIGMDDAKLALMAGTMWGRTLLAPPSTPA